MACEASGVWRGTATRLDRALPELGLARSRSQAAELIAGGTVRVNGANVIKAGTRVVPGSLIDVAAIDRYVSRAAHKLAAGLDVFGLDPEGVLALDVGASTGGFTQVLLERGAAQVLAIDVGHGQLVEGLRLDPRVRSVEGCNARDLTPESLAAITGVDGAPRLVVGDLSFISLELVLPALASVASEDAEFVLLIKPQFEVGRQGVSGGIVTDTELACGAIERVILAAADLGLECRGLTVSPVTGEHGNREMLAYFVRALAADPSEWLERIRELFDVGGGA